MRSLTSTGSPSRATAPGASHPVAGRESLPAPTGAPLLLICAAAGGLWLSACGGAPETPSGGGPQARPSTPVSTPGGTGVESSGGGAGYTKVEVTDGGRITGRVVFDGTAPGPKVVKVTKDRAVCAATEHTTETLVVGEDGGVLNAVVSIVSIDRGKPFPAGDTPTLDQRGCWFYPHVQVMPAGGSIEVVNSDGILHNIHTYPKNNRPINVAQPKFKRVITQSFAEPDIVRVGCDVHTWMNAWIVVTAHPYHAVTDVDGSFLLDQVPPGSYTLGVWHETLGERTRPATVSPGDTAEVSFVYGE